jgi:hypothetical protein
MNSLIHLLLLCCLLTNISCNSAPPLQENNNEPVTHEQWSGLLGKYVSPAGKVDYQGFIKDSLSLNAYLMVLEENAPNNNWTENEQKAYWINAYNAYTIQLIIRYYPLRSIKDIGNSIQVPFVNTPWDLKFIRIGNHTYDLNNIEHDILRENFDDPRIHFAIVCASRSCPKLLDAAYEAAKLHQQLDQQTRVFLKDESRNKISNDEASVSKIFDWFEDDFTRKGSLINFLNQYSEVRIDEKAKISYLPYDWGLNE